MLSTESRCPLESPPIRSTPIAQLCEHTLVPPTTHYPRFSLRSPRPLHVFTTFTARLNAYCFLRELIFIYPFYALMFVEHGLSGVEDFDTVFDVIGNRRDQVDPVGRAGGSVFEERSIVFGSGPSGERIQLSIIHF